jgi:hypothetical protein
MDAGPKGRQRRARPKAATRATRKSERLAHAAFERIAKDLVAMRHRLAISGRIFAAVPHLLEIASTLRNVVAVNFSSV